MSSDPQISNGPSRQKGNARRQSCLRHSSIKATSIKDHVQSTSIAYWKNNTCWQQPTSVIAVSHSVNEYNSRTHGIIEIVKIAEV